MEIPSVTVLVVASSISLGYGNFFSVKILNLRKESLNALKVICSYIVQNVLCNDTCINERRIEYFKIVDLHSSFFYRWRIASHRVTTEYDKIIIYGAALCADFFFPKRYRGVEKDWSLSQTYEIPPACVNTNLLVASFTQSYIDIAASTRENTASIDRRVRAFLFHRNCSFVWWTRYKRRRSRRSHDSPPLRTNIRAHEETLKFFLGKGRRVLPVTSKFWK